MRIIHIDESGTPSQRRFVVGGPAMPESGALARTFAALRGSYPFLGWPLHAAHIRLPAYLALRWCGFASSRRFNDPPPDIDRGSRSPSEFASALLEARRFDQHLAFQVLLARSDADVQHRTLHLAEFIRSSEAAAARHPPGILLRANHRTELRDIRRWGRHAQIDDVIRAFRSHIVDSIFTTLLRHSEIAFVTVSQDRRASGGDDRYLRLLGATLDVACAPGDTARVQRRHVHGRSVCALDITAQSTLTANRLEIIPFDEHAHAGDVAADFLVNELRHHAPRPSAMKNALAPLDLRIVDLLDNPEPR